MSVKALIIEDEPLAAQSLTNLIGEVDATIEVVAVTQSIAESVEWFGLHPAPDIVFMDIHLADGSSFSIFDEVEIAAPIIFTTAYDEYALRAFGVNSVDYLLKPIAKADLERALGKIKLLREGDGTAAGRTPQPELIRQLMDTLRDRPVVYKSSILVAAKDKLIPVSVRDIAMFRIENKLVKAVTFDGRVHALDLTMDECMQQLDPECFYRANRQYIISRRAVKDVSLWFGGKLAVNLCVPTPERVQVSRTNAREFKQWLTM